MTPIMCPLIVYPIDYAGSNSSVTRNYCRFIEETRCQHKLFEAAKKDGLPVTEFIASLHHAKVKFLKAFLKKVGPVDASKHATVVKKWKNLSSREPMESLMLQMTDYQQKQFPEVSSHAPSVLLKKDLKSSKPDLDFLFHVGDNELSPEVFTVKPPKSTTDLHPDVAGKISSTIYCDAAMMYRMSEVQVLHRAESPSCSEATNIMSTVGTSLGHQTLLNECNVCHKVFHLPATPAVTITLPDGSTKQSSPPLLTALTAGLASGTTKATVMRMAASFGLGTATTQVVYIHFAFYIDPNFCALCNITHRILLYFPDD